jgi:hypothetical protein
MTCGTAVVQLDWRTRMLRRSKLLPVALIALAGVLLSGCPEVAQLIPSLNIVQVELINDTNYVVDANIRFDDDAGWLAGWFPAEDLNAGLLDAGESAQFNFDCDELGLILSDEAEQLGPFLITYVADATRILERDDEYECGDVIRFRFVGDGDDFGVIVSVNGRIVD